MCSTPPSAARFTARPPLRLARTTRALALATALVLTTITSTTEHTAPHPPRPVNASGAWATPGALKRLVADGAPGAAALATRGADPAAARFTTAGVADLTSRRPIRRADHFRAGSLTKTFIAAVVLQLAAEGRLTLDAPAAPHLPARVRHAPALARVSVRQLLDHTSGLFDYTQDPRLSRRLHGHGFPAHRYDTHTPAGLLRTALRHPPPTAPGTRYAYSNTNYVLLGMLIGQLTGRPYAEEVRRRILAPFRLTGTTFPGTSPALPQPYGRAYSLIGHHRVDTTALDPSRAGAAGEIVTTLDDLNRFFAALLGGRLLPPRQMAQLLDPRHRGNTYGLGLYATELPCGTTVWGHNGDINGSYTRSAASPSGHHILTFHLNTDTLTNPALTTSVLTAEFCPPKSSPGQPKSSRSGA